GLGTDSPKARHADVYRLVSRAFIGLPCPKKAAGMVMTRAYRCPRPELLASRGVIVRRDYSPADADGLMRFAQRVWTPDARWHLGDIAWEFASGLVEDPRMALWEDNGTVVAWGWLAPPDRVALMVDPGRVDTLVDAVVDWAAARAGGPVSVGILDTE